MGDFYSLQSLLLTYSNLFQKSLFESHFSSLALVVVFSLRFSQTTFFLSNVTLTIVHPSIHTAQQHRQAATPGSRLPALYVHPFRLLTEKLNHPPTANTRARTR